MPWCPRRRLHANMLTRYFQSHRFRCCVCPRPLRHVFGEKRLRNSSQRIGIGCVIFSPLSYGGRQAGRILSAHPQSSFEHGWIHENSYSSISNPFKLHSCFGGNSRGLWVRFFLFHVEFDSDFTNLRGIWVRILCLCSAALPSHSLMVIIFSNHLCYSILHT